MQSCVSDRGMGILHISSASNWWKICRIRFTSHSFPSASMRWLTHGSRVLLMNAADVSHSFPGIHWSRWIWIFFPSPTLQTRPFFSNSSPCSMPLHTGEASDEKTVSSRSPLGKYLDLRTRAHRLSGFWMSLHPWLASSAKLNRCISLNPIHPALFGWVMRSQDIQWTFLCSFSSPHQKSLIIFSYFSQKPLERRKTPIMKVGSAWATDLTCTSLAAYDMNLSFQLLHLFPNLSMIGWKCSSFILPSSVGSPKYMLPKVDFLLPTPIWCLLSHSLDTPHWTK